MLQALARDLVREGDVFTVESTGPSSVSLPLSADRARLEVELGRVAGSGLKVKELQEGAAGPLGRREVDYRFRIAVTAARRMLDEVPARPARRRAMLYISNGYDVEGATPRLAVLARAARRANVRVFAIDPRGIPGATVRRATLEGGAAERHWLSTNTSLHRLAEQTGGFATRDQLDVAQVVRRIATAVRPSR